MDYLFIWAFPVRVLDDVEAVGKKHVQGKCREEKYP
jgi:hypothetical protein